MKRDGMACRVHDFGRLTVGIDPQARGGCYSPQAFAIYRGSRWPLWGRVVRMPLPHLSFAWAYRLRRVGGLRVYAALARLYYQVGR